MKLSIVTINYNNAEGLRKTMESVLKQTYYDFEYIIVDGASTDGSADVIRASALQAEGLNIKWMSEPDTGIYNEMNKGIEIALGKRIVNSFNRSELVEDKNKDIKMASGEYLLFLNSGDSLVDESVVGRIVPELGKADIIQGNVFLDKVGGELRRGYGKSDLSFIEVYEGKFLHQATFFSSSLFEEYGMYNETVKLGGDTFFYLKALGLGSASFLYIDQVISVFMSNGLSSSKEGYWYEVIKKEDTLYDAQVPPRILRLVKEDRKKYELYDILHRYPIIWKIAMLLKKMALKKMVRCESKK
jgi:glycosyltransferase involved in cell wall biosynthesis